MKNVPLLDGLSVYTECKDTTETGINQEKASVAPLLKVNQHSPIPFDNGPRDMPVNKRKIESETAAAVTTETGGNAEIVTAAAPIPNFDQQFEIDPSDASAKKQKTECLNTAAVTKTVSPIVKATAAPLLHINKQLLAPAAPLLNINKPLLAPAALNLDINKQLLASAAPLRIVNKELLSPAAPLLKVSKKLLVPVGISAPQIPAFRIVKLRPKTCQLPSQLNKMNFKKVMFKTAVVNSQPTKLIRPVQSILRAAPASNSMTGIAAQGSHPTALPLRMACVPFKPTERQSAVTASAQTGSFVGDATSALPNVAQRVSVSRVMKPLETPAEKKLKQKTQQLYSQLWRKNRKIEALKRKVAETLPESKRVLRSVEAILEAAKHFLTPLQLSLLRAQLLNSQKEKNGYRWSTSDKIFGLQLLYKNSAAFRFVSQHLALPTQGTLRKFVAETLGGEGSEAATEISALLLPPDLDLQIGDEDLETDDGHQV